MGDPYARGAGIAAHEIPPLCPRIAAAVCRWPVCGILATGCAPPDEHKETPTADTWQTVFHDLPGALISVWGTTASNVWAVGADPGDGSGPLVLHLQAGQWQRLATGQTGDLWWVHGLPGGDVLMGGAGGMILRYRTGAFERMATPGNRTIFGIWAASDVDVWAVGGDPLGTNGAFIWRFDGTDWTAVANLPAGTQAPAYFKVWGRSSNDVLVVGGGGVVLHYNGSSFATVTSNTTRTLLTVHTAGVGQPYMAVGGFGHGLILQCDDVQTGCTDVTPFRGDRPGGRVDDAGGRLCGGL